MPLYIKELIIYIIYLKLFKIYFIFKEKPFIKGLNCLSFNLYKF
jgi:hypothetical protein